MKHFVRKAAAWGLAAILGVSMPISALAADGTAESFTESEMEEVPVREAFEPESPEAEENPDAGFAAWEDDSAPFKADAEIFGGGQKDLKL